MTTGTQAAARAADVVRLPRVMTSGAWAVVGLCLLLALAARTTGAGWLVVIMCVLAGGLVVGLAWPALAVRRAVAALAGPGDATAGEELLLRLTVRRAGLGVLARLGDGPWTAVVDGETAGAILTPHRRGRLDGVRVTLASGAPLGMRWARRTVTVALERAVLVAPRTGSVTEVPERAGRHDGDLRTGVPHHGDHLRSVREYHHGDPMRLVHWPATARRGELVVKELEQPARPHLNVVVVLSGAAEADETAAERAMGIVAHALDDERAVTLFTVDADGPHITRVRALRDAGRRLAVAGPGAPPGPAPGAGEVVTIRSGRS